MEAKQERVQLLTRLLTGVKQRESVQANMSVGLRLTQIYFVALLVCALGYALITNPSNFVYDFSMVHAASIPR